MRADFRDHYRRPQYGPRFHVKAGGAMLFIVLVMWGALLALAWSMVL